MSRKPRGGLVAVKGIGSDSFTLKVKVQGFFFRFIHIVKCTCDSAEQSFRAFGRISCGWMVLVVVMTHEVGEETK